MRDNLWRDTLHRGKVYASSVDFTHFIRLGFIKIPQGWGIKSLAALELRVWQYFDEIKFCNSFIHSRGSTTLTQSRKDLLLNALNKSRITRITD